MSQYMLRIRRATGFSSIELTPELKSRIGLFAAASLGIGLLAILVLQLIGATFEPFAWTVLVCAGATYGWFARSQLTMTIPSLSNTTVGPLHDEDFGEDFSNDMYNVDDEED